MRQKIAPAPCQQSLALVCTFLHPLLDNRNLRSQVIIPGSATLLLPCAGRIGESKLAQNFERLHKSDQVRVTQATYRPDYRVLIDFEHFERCKLYEIRGQSIEIIVGERKDFEVDHTAWNVWQAF